MIGEAQEWRGGKEWGGGQERRGRRRGGASEVAGQKARGAGGEDCDGGVGGRWGGFGNRMRRAEV